MTIVPRVSLPTAIALLALASSERSFAAGGAFINYPGTTSGLSATVVSHTVGLDVAVDTANSGDWKLAFNSIAYDQARGVVIPAAYPTYGADHIGISGNPGRAFIEVAGRYSEAGATPGFANGWLAMTDISGNGTEANFDVGLAYFPFSEGWKSANVSSTGVINAGNTSGVTVARDADDPGRFTLSISGVNSRTSGMLFTVGGDNGNSGNTVATEVRADGSGWDIISYDQAGTFTDVDGDLEGDGGQDGSFQFVYVPYDTQNLIGGRIDDDGSIMNGTSGFSASRTSTGSYLLQISDGAGGFLDSSDGLIIANVSKGAVLASGPAVDPDDNLLELSYNAGSQGWNVSSFDLPGAGFQDTEFVFAFVPYSAALTIPEPSTALMAAAGLGLLLSGRRRRAAK